MWFRDGALLRRCVLCVLSVCVCLETNANWGYCEFRKCVCGDGLCELRGSLCGVASTDASSTCENTCSRRRQLHRQPWQTCACHVLSSPKSLAPLELRDGRPLGRLGTIAFPLSSPHPSPEMTRRGLALAGVPAPRDAPCSTSTSALHRARPLYGHDAKGHGRAATAWPWGGTASALTPTQCCSSYVKVGWSSFHIR